MTRRRSPPSAVASVEEPTVFVALVHPFARKRDLIDASRRITDMNAGHCVKSEKGH